MKRKIPEEISRLKWDSNPGQLGEKHEFDLSAMLPQQLTLSYSCSGGGQVVGRVACNLELLEFLSFIPTISKLFTRK